MKYLKTVVLLLLFTIIKADCVKAQEIIREDLPFDTVQSLAPPNDTLIDPENFPFGFGRVIEKTCLGFDSTKRTKQIQVLVDEWLEKYEIADNGKTGFCYGLVQEKDNRVYIKKLPTRVVYLFGEIGGGYKVTRTIAVYGDYIDKLVDSWRPYFGIPDSIPTVDENENDRLFNPGKFEKPLICLFDQSLTFDEREVKMQLIKPEKPIKFPYERAFGESVLEKNIRIQFDFNKSVYELRYTASLNNDDPRIRNGRESYPHYFNFKLNLINTSTDKEQVIFKAPDHYSYNITDIMIGDIDNDMEPDIIYSICNEVEACKYRSIFLSSQKEEKPLLKYMGQTEVYRIDP